MFALGELSFLEKKDIIEKEVYINAQSNANLDTQGRVVFFFGLPGSGKGTQADYLADNYGFFHFDTGKEIQKIVHDPARADDPIIQEHRKVFESGVLNDPTWVRQLIHERVGTLAAEGKSLVFSGSPRTLEEAEDIIPFLASLYGKEHLVPVLIEISEDSAVYRNSHRRICKVCRRAVMWSEDTQHMTQCLACGGELITRGNLDNAETIRNERIPQYLTRTKPVLAFIEKEGYSLLKINGEQSSSQVNSDVVQTLGLYK